MHTAHLQTVHDSLTTIRCYLWGIGGSSSEQVSTGLQCWPPDVTRGPRFDVQEGPLSDVFKWAWWQTLGSVYYDQMDLCVRTIFNTRNEVWARLCFHRHVWFCSQGVCLSTCWDTTSQEQTPPPPQSRHPPGSRHPPPPGAEHAGRYGQRAGGTHPNGMQSFLMKKSSMCKAQIEWH